MTKEEILTELASLRKKVGSLGLYLLADYVQNAVDQAKLDKLSSTEVVIDPQEKAAVEKAFAHNLKEYRKRKRYVCVHARPLLCPHACRPGTSSMPSSTDIPRSPSSSTRRSGSRRTRMPRSTFPRSSSMLWFVLLCLCSKSASVHQQSIQSQILLLLCAETCQGHHIRHRAIRCHALVACTRLSHAQPHPHTHLSCPMHRRRPSSCCSTATLAGRCTRPPSSVGPVSAQDSLTTTRVPGRRSR